jgi:osmotically-inducible protein OsmY
MSDYNEERRRSRNPELTNREREQMRQGEMPDYDFYGSPAYEGGRQEGGGRNNQQQDRQREREMNTQQGRRNQRDYYYAGSQQTSNREDFPGREDDYGYGGMQPPRGQHYGRGPQGYKRSKDRIMEDVCETLMHHGDIDATNIRVQVDDNGEVTLEGTVDSRQTKRMAEDVIENVSGVEEVHNRLRVQGQNSGS